MIININIYNLRCINQIEKCGCKNNLKKKKPKWVTEWNTDVKFLLILE